MIREIAVTAVVCTLLACGDNSRKVYTAGDTVASPVDSVPSAAQKTESTTTNKSPAKDSASTAIRTKPASGTPGTTPDSGTTDPTVRPAPPIEPVTLRSVRTSVRGEDGVERLVLEFDGDKMPGYSIAYENPPLHQCGSGAPVPLAGRAVFRVRVEPANAHAQSGERVESTIPDRNRKVSQPFIRQLAMTCDFEGQVEFGLGLITRRPYRVLTLTSPTRLVVDFFTR